MIRTHAGGDLDTIIVTNNALLQLKIRFSVIKIGIILWKQFKILIALFINIYTVKVMLNERVTTY